MTNEATVNTSSELPLRFRARVENGIIIPEETISLPPGHTYWVTLQTVSPSETDVDALAEIAALAQPLGPDDLARNFDIYTDQIIDDEPTP